MALNPFRSLLLPCSLFQKLATIHPKSMAIILATVMRHMHTHALHVLVCKLRIHDKDMQRTSHNKDIFSSMLSWSESNLLLIFPYLFSDFVQPV